MLDLECLEIIHYYASQYALVLKIDYHRYTISFLLAKNLLIQNGVPIIRTQDGYCTVTVGDLSRNMLSQYVAIAMIIT